MDAADQQQAIAGDAPGEGGDRRMIAVIAALALAVLSGLVVVGIAGALETSDDCSTYGYGGYNCVDYTDAQLVVEPSADLVDLQIVSVTGVDFDPPFAPFAASQCVATGLDEIGQAGCDADTTTIWTVNSDGSVFFTMRLKRIIETDALGEVDCAEEGACVIGAASVEGTPTDFVVIEGTSAPIAFDPAVPPADLTDAEVFVEPSTDLVDRQTVTVNGINLDPHFSSFGAAQCDAALLEEFQVDACDLSTSLLGSVDGEGNAEVDLTVRRIITTAIGGEVDCAVPGACAIGGGTFVDFATTTATEGAFAAISFDPDVPPVPPLEIDVTVDEVTASSVSGSVACNRTADQAADFQVDGYVEQEKAGEVATASGYLSGVDCHDEGSDWTMPLTSYQRRLTGGTATFMAYVYAYDGFDSVFEELTEDMQLRGGPRPSTPAIAVDGEFTSIRIVGAEGTGQDQRIIVEVTCDRVAEYAGVYVSLRQTAGLDMVSAWGNTQIPSCDGVNIVEVPIYPGGGVLVGGPAQVSAEVSVHADEPPDYWHDFATAVDQVRLSGQLAPELFDPEPNPDSRITIDTVTKTSIDGTVECDEPVMVELYGNGVQQHGRTTDGAGGYSSFACDGTTPYSIDLATYSDGLRAGSAAVSVSGSGYVVVEGPDYGYYEYVWSDYQQASVRVRGSG